MLELLHVSEVKIAPGVIKKSLKISLAVVLLTGRLIPIFCIEQGILGIMFKNVQFSFMNDC